MRPDVVVVGDETVQLDLELGHRGAHVLALEELLERVSGPAENNDGSRSAGGPETPGTPSLGRG